jgi:predicted MPP superfamily phosphohydrolase
VDSESLNRRCFLTTGTATLASATVPLLDPKPTADVQLSTHVVPVPGLPRAFAGFRIAQVADLHLYNGVHPAARAALAMLDRERPDLVVLTGDQWDRRPGAQSLATWLGELPASTQVIAVPGNHDYGSGFSRADAERAHERGGAQLLVNQAAVLRRGPAALAIVGLEDLRSGPTDPVAALDGVGAEAPQVWLHHEPAQIDAIRFPQHARAALALGGHTHGGQVRVLGMSPVRPRGAGRYLAGWYRSPIGPYYVSRGVGASGLRVRVDCPPELPIFRLVEG